MPELPEVETIRRGLCGFCLQQKIKRVMINCDKSFIGPKEIIEGQRIDNIRRFGKALVFDLTGNVSMMIHLRMTGQLIYRPKGKKLGDEDSFAGGHPTDSFLNELPDKQTRVIFELEKGTLYFNDQRKFGFVKVIPTAEVEDDNFIRQLAPEPWDMDVDDFYNRLKRHKNSCIKATILDQKIICGLGNIYADEALYYASIHPERLAGSLSEKEAENLLEGARKVMEASINSGGSTMATYVKADGTKGDYLRLFAKVFRREGEPCERCGTEIEKIRVAGRGTHICPYCQQKTSRQETRKVTR
ncbi:bifunctional DNA-formamidopyrimidine glycosylase/DNA-(apurinic or apyrimidinic site) lyase [Candidatus Saccharibacteria bacterium]|nr:bifunctional DNA-formamidopyrimidine glycosylase/DNA-(apurinic or apyrimidinic site) lyase [Candidatus Saccharibacteria bacterium]